MNKVSKDFNLGFKKQSNALDRVISLISGKESIRRLRVLEDISFKAVAGENIGLIGRNGSGKSTLLKLIAGIYQVDSGSFSTEGEIVYLSGFGFGLKERMTMRENIKLVGLLMGLSKKDINNRFAEIVKFSELEDFVDTKIYQFSSGMLSRLRFSITIHCLQEKKADIVLLDEVFSSGGDLTFENKAIAKMEEFIRGGSTVILVSHNLMLIEKYCNRVLFLEKGKIMKEGETLGVIKAYQDSFSKTN